MLADSLQLVLIITRKDTKMPNFQRDIHMFFARDKGDTFIFFGL